MGSIPICSIPLYSENHLGKFLGGFWLGLVGDENGRVGLILLIVTGDFPAMGKEMTHQDFLFGCGGMGINQIG